MTKRNDYLERTRISDVRRLAMALGLTTDELLQASLSLSKDGTNVGSERSSELPQFRDTDVAFPA